MSKIVIIGGVAAGPKVAARARRLMPDAEITIIEKGRLISYAGCGMPFYVGGQIKDFNQLFSTSYGVMRDEHYFMNEKGVKVLTRTEATAIDREKKEVTVTNLDTGETFTIPYDKLVLATGSEPFVPPIPGMDLKGVHRLNHPDDARGIMEQVEGVGEAVVIGAGLIGMEAADALVKRRIFVSVVELKDQILPGVLDPDLAAVLAYRLEEAGVEFHLGTKVLRLEGDDEGNVARVVTESGAIDAEMVIVAVGVRPNVKLAREAGLAIGETGAIQVNEYLQTSDPDIYAVGDCVENRHLVSGRMVYIPLASTANRQGRVAGDNVAGGRSRFKGVLGTAVLKVMGWNVGRTGLGEQQARELGYDVTAAVNATHDRTHYYPGHDNLLMKLVVEKGSRRILGAQAIGGGEVVKRIDVVATALHFGATVDDLADVDLGYAPPFSTPIDPAHHTANIVRNKLAGLARTITAQELKEKMDRGDDFVLLDVRTPEQYNYRHIADDRVMLVTLGDLRRRIEEIPRDKEIVTLCALGMRAYEAMRTLAGAGFKDVKFVEGGLQAWPYDLE
ncbi:pyridine nucleotide-disulfide oxidoreductase [Desulfofundulus thermobenzoicus]|uniref:Pyridine nucleotide-disulfide oxidoreductase n=1 Tax=Desulfofundulus thermobenzoicus TaxID=29376 RepID=A0A6N7IQ26_9FIRM|nr:pyridine nucleotide-disulfide oxidoreductase [Desulfofundulus thermobenzoicus]HHW45011.1 FAD-dependent oxidoreductase [Desulfotomaculum sp.]